MVQLLTYVPATDFPKIHCTPGGKTGDICLDGRSSLPSPNVEPFLANGLALRAQMVMPLLSLCLCLHVT